LDLSEGVVSVDLPNGVQQVMALQLALRGFEQLEAASFGVDFHHLHYK
jgi:hypothetical protein